MARVNGKAPPVFSQRSYPANFTDCYVVIEASTIPAGSRVTVRMKSGEIVEGKLTDHCDWLVGCPVVTTDDGDMIGIGYHGDIVDVVTGEAK